MSEYHRGFADLYRIRRALVRASKAFPESMGEQSDGSGVQDGILRRSALAQTLF